MRLKKPCQCMGLDLWQARSSGTLIVSHVRANWPWTIAWPLSVGHRHWSGLHSGKEKGKKKKKKKPGQTGHMFTFSCLRSAAKSWVTIKVRSQECLTNFSGNKQGKIILKKYWILKLWKKQRQQDANQGKIWANNLIEA